MVVAKKAETPVVKKVVPGVAEPTVELVDTAPIHQIQAPEESVIADVVQESVIADTTPIRPVAQFKYADSPFPETCTWLDAHGLDPENVGVGGISKGGYRNLMDEDRNWPFTAREVDELWAIYEAELNAADEEEGTVGE